jgi:hypothetical protein
MIGTNHLHEGMHAAINRPTQYSKHNDAFGDTPGAIEVTECGLGHASSRAMPCYAVPYLALLACLVSECPIYYSY